MTDKTLLTGSPEDIQRILNAVRWCEQQMRGSVQNNRPAGFSLPVSSGSVSVTAMTDSMASTDTLTGFYNGTYQQLYMEPNNNSSPLPQWVSEDGGYGDSNTQCLIVPPNGEVLQPNTNYQGYVAGVFNGSSIMVCQQVGSGGSGRQPFWAELITQDPTPGPGWNFKPVALVSGSYVAGTVTTGYPLIPSPLTFAGSDLLNPVPGDVVLVIPSTQSGLFESLPIGYAAYQKPGLINSDLVNTQYVGGGSKEIDGGLFIDSNNCTTGMSSADIAVSTVASYATEGLGYNAISLYAIPIGVTAYGGFSIYAAALSGSACVGVQMFLNDSYQPGMTVGTGSGGRWVSFNDIDGLNDPPRSDIQFLRFGWDFNDSDNGNQTHVTYWCQLPNSLGNDSYFSIGSNRGIWVTDLMGNVYVGGIIIQAGSGGSSGSVP